MKAKHKGFTLIEIVVVMVLLGILAASSMPAIDRLLNSYRNQSDYAAAVSSAHLVSERITRALRNVAPENVNIVRNVDGQCLDIGRLDDSRLVRFCAHNEALFYYQGDEVALLTGQLSFLSLSAW